MNPATLEFKQRELCEQTLRNKGGVTKVNMQQFKGLGIKRALEGIGKLWRDEQGQDIAEYAVMLAVILIIVIGTVKLIGANANSTFSNVASSVQ
jgi:Flp pilus assembly pilin Flp